MIKCVSGILRAAPSGPRSCKAHRARAGPGHVAAATTGSSADIGNGLTTITPRFGILRSPRLETFGI